MGDSDFDTDDVDDFRARFGLPKNTPTKIYDGSNPGTGSATGEALLDVSWSGAVATDATILFIGATLILLSEDYAIDNNVADIVTSSFFSCEANFTGSNEATLTLRNELREQAAAQGITWVGITGDSGPYNCENFHRELSYSQTPVLAVNALASSAYVVAVGGTQFLDTTDPGKYWSSNGAALGYIPEGAWNQSCMVDAACFTSIVASGGGQSTEPGGKPSWQAAVGVGPTKVNDNTRDLPDVSLSASWEIDPYIICMNRSCENATSFRFYSTGGTSASAPSFAGILALVKQKVGGRLGAVNPVLYRLANNQFSECLGVASPTSGCVYNDITSGNTSTPGSPNSEYAATAGYDMATGLGSVNVGNLLNLWNQGTLDSTVTSLSISPATLVHGANAQVTIKVTPQTGSGTPTGPVSLLTGASQLICPGVPTSRTAPDGCMSVGAPVLNNGSIQSSISGLPGGSYTVTASYGGDGTFAPSVSSGLKVVVTPEPSTLSLTASASSGVYGEGIQLLAQLQTATDSGVPTGSITFSDNGKTFLTTPINTSGAVDVNILFPPGSHTVSATYSGDSSFQSSATTASASIQVQKAATSLNVTFVCASPGSAVTAALVYSSDGSIPTGSVAFSLGGSNLATVTLNAGVATYTIPSTVSPLPAVIEATYTGNSNFAPSAPVAINVGLPACALSLRDSATNTLPAAVGGLATIYGSSLASQIATAATPAWPTTLGGATVTFTDANNVTAQAQLYYVSPNQINLCVPPTLAAGPVSVQVGGSATSNVFQGTIQPSSPSIFAAQILDIASNGALTFKPLAPITFPSQTSVFLILYASGLRNHSASSVVQVSIGDTLIGTYPVQPAFAGPEGVFPGLDQVNVIVPAELAGSGSATAYITINDSATGDTLQESNSLALTFP